MKKTKLQNLVKSYKSCRVLWDTKNQFYFEYMKNLFIASLSFVLNTRWKPINWEYLDFPLDVFRKKLSWESRIRTEPMRVRVSVPHLCTANSTSLPSCSSERSFWKAKENETEKKVVWLWNWIKGEEIGYQFNAFHQNSLANLKIPIVFITIYIIR